MQTTSLTELVHQHLHRRPRGPPAGGAHTVYGGHEHTLRQTPIALASCHRLDEHESPGEYARPAWIGAPD